MKKGSPSWIQKAHLPFLVIGNPEDVMIIKSRSTNEINNLCYISLIEPKNAYENTNVQLADFFAFGHMMPFSHFLFIFFLDPF